MEEQTAVKPYEAPALVALGEFNEDTLGEGKGILLIESHTSYGSF
ncbi:lasso RiPP family leader peptide-containing protein [Streptomyces sp. NPDC051658]